MRSRKRVLSILLTFSMVLSLFAGQIVVKKEAKAVENPNKIELGNSTESTTTGSYSYQNVEITLQDPSRPLYQLSVSVDNGYMMTTQNTVASTKGTGIKISDGSNGAVTIDELTTTDRFESIAFEFENGVNKSVIEEFVKQVQFYPGEGVQMVSVSATGIKDPETVINGKTIKLKYFNGHFYGIFSAGDQPWSYGTWKQSYKMALDARFAGVKGYLMTLTSRPEDRFVWAAFGAEKGWMGCTRATTTDGKYGSKDAVWNDLADFDTNNPGNNVWRWVCGPEAGQAFGYQNSACGWRFSPVLKDWPYHNDGGFYTYDGWFSNWNVNKWKTNSQGQYEPKEPNGGKLPVDEGVNCNEDEGFGYYAESQEGNWNDHRDTDWKRAYIEFGSPTEQFGNENGELLVIVTETKGSDGNLKEEPTAAPEKATDNPNWTEPPVQTAVPTPTAKPTKDPEKKTIEGKPAIIRHEGKSSVSYRADITDVGPEGATVEYKWFEKMDDGTLVPLVSPLSGTQYTGPQITRPKDEEKTYVVEVIGTGEYTGILESDPMAPISGRPIIESQEKDENGIDVVRYGSVLEANIKEVIPEEVHDSLQYQWYYLDEYGNENVIKGATSPRIILDDELLSKELVVHASVPDGHPRYYGEVESAPYNTTPTTSSVQIGDGKDDPDVPDGKRVITIHPTDPDSIYGILDEQGKPLIPGESEVVAKDGDGNDITPDVEGEDAKEHPGYYKGKDKPGETIKFIVDPDKTYIISQIKTKHDIESETKDVISPDIPDDKIKTDYDDKGTKDDKSDDKITIIVDPADKDNEYAVLKKREDGSYEEVPVKKDPTTGKYVYDPDGTNTWSDGDEDIVEFSELDPGIYKVVAKSKDPNLDDVTPSEIKGGSKDVDVSEPPSDGTTPSPTPGTPGTGTTPGTPGTTPGTGGTTPTTTPPTVYTKQEQDNAAKFVKEHLTDPKGKVVTGVTDLTRDLIVSGESDWKKLTDREKQAVNEKLKAAGCPYTYEQLLKMAKTYKIPGFKVIKFMQKKSKAKLKLIKCKGATIACSSTNSKVATISKKGVISAKKVGRATLTFTAIKGKNTNRLVIDVRVKKKFKNAKELTKLNSKAIKTPTALIAKKRLLKKSSRIDVYDLEKSSKVKFEALNKKVLTINKKGKYTGKKKGNSLVRIRVDQNKKVYWLYVYVTIY